MAASSVPIRREVPDLREELTQAGVRFVYFSSRNMRRSKPVAEKIGLQFDWNVRERLLRLIKSPVYYFLSFLSIPLSTPHTHFLYLIHSLFVSFLPLPLLTFFECILHNRLPLPIPTIPSSSSLPSLLSCYLLSLNFLYPISLSLTPPLPYPCTLLKVCDIFKSS